MTDAGTTGFGEYRSWLSGHRIHERAGGVRISRSTAPAAAAALATLAVLGAVLHVGTDRLGTVAWVVAAVPLLGGAGLALLWRSECEFRFDRRRFRHRNGLAWSPPVVDVPFEAIEAVVVGYRRAVRVAPGEVHGAPYATVGVRLAGRAEPIQVWTHHDSERAAALARLLAERTGRPVADERPPDVLEAERTWRRELERIVGDETGGEPR